MSRIEILNLAGLRHDNRRPYELRALSFTLSPHPNADGSASVTQGLTSVTACVFGPREPKQRAGAAHDRASVVVEVGVAPWSQGQAGGRGRSRGDKRLLEIAAAIRQTFEPVIITHLYPRSEIAIQVQVLQADGGILPTAINAVTLALLDAGISLLDYVTAVSVGLHLKQALLDLSAPEESDLPVLVVASLPSSGKVTLAQMETRLHVDRFEEMLRLATDACAVLKDEMDKVARQRTARVVERMETAVSRGVVVDQAAQ